MAVLSKLIRFPGSHRIIDQRMVWLIVSLLWFGTFETSAQEDISKEYKIKAVFLFNFTQFVNWPPAAFADPEAPMTIGVLGDNPFGNYLDKTIHGEKADGRALAIRFFKNIDQVKDCQILFISRSETKNMKMVLAKLKNQYVLTVGDTDDFSHDGGIVRFATEQNKIHFKISLKAAKAANLTISSQLLRLADVVEPAKD